MFYLPSHFPYQKKLQYDSPPEMTRAHTNPLRPVWVHALHNLLARGCLGCYTLPFPCFVSALAQTFSLLCWTTMMHEHMHHIMKYVCYLCGGGVGSPRD